MTIPLDVTQRIAVRVRVCRKMIRLAKVRLKRILMKSNQPLCRGVLKYCTRYNRARNKLLGIMTTTT